MPNVKKKKKIHDRIKLYLHLVAFNAMDFVRSIQGEWYSIQRFGTTGTSKAFWVVRFPDSLQDTFGDFLIAHYAIFQCVLQNHNNQKCFICNVIRYFLY